VSLPWDRNALSSPGWRHWLVLGIAVVVVLIVLFGGMAAVRHRSDVMERMVGSWRQPGHDIELSIDSVPLMPGTSLDTVVDRLTVAGTIDGRTVRGGASLPRIPPWGSTVHVTLSGERWTLRYDGSAHQLVATREDGRRFTLTRP